MKTHFMLGMLTIFSAVSLFLETSLMAKSSKQQHENLPVSNLPASQGVVVPNDRCGEPVGNDVCIVGNFDGRNFNRIISMAHALHEVQRQGGTGVLRLTPKGMKWYREWFDDDPSKVQTVTEKCRPKLCATEKKWIEFFYHSKTAKSQQEKEEIIRGKQVALSSTLVGMLRKDYLEQARDQIEEYRRKGFATPQQLRSNNSKMHETKVVTVHARWIEGTCLSKATTGKNACEQPQYQQLSSTSKPTFPLDWIKACEYTENFVRQHLPPDIADDNNTVIVLLGDGQNEKSESTFQIRDQNNFQIQSFMMTLSDYHFGNPQSSADAIIANWRKGKKTFPEDCFVQSP